MRPRLHGSALAQAFQNNQSAQPHNNSASTAKAMAVVFNCPTSESADVRYRMRTSFDVRIEPGGQRRSALLASAMR